MATINLGAIKFNWKGAYNSGTSYAVDDVVSSGGSSYVCIQASTGNAVGNATAYWNIMSLAGTNGSNGSAGDTFGLANKEIAFKTNAGALDGIAIGTAGQALKVNSGATGYEFGAVAGGKVLQVIQKTSITRASFQGSADNSPEAGRAITHLEQVITPSASSSKILATVTIVGNASNDAFPNLSYKSSAQVGLGFGTIHNGTHVHATSPSGQTPTMGGDYENGSTNNKIRNSTYSFLHSPNTTNAVYYMPTVSIWSGQYFFFNRGEADGGVGWYGAGMSSITLMEIGA